jgi:hypothetical protein
MSGNTLARDVGFDYGAAIRTVTDAYEAGQISLREYAEALNSLGSDVNAAISGVKAFSTIIAQWQTAFAAAADLAAGNVNELVNLYNAQINAISAQNRYTQALALQATALTIYGAGSEQATRATTAANYVSALYTQSKVNETVALNQYATATLKNTATIATSFTTMIAALQAFEISLTVATSTTLSNSAKVALAAIPLVGMVAALGLTAYQLATSNQAGMPTHQTGGRVFQTGPAFLHAGETVLPKGVSSSNMGNVEIHIHASSNMDLARIRQEIQNVLSRTMLEAQRQRGVY